jgi:hypothetical protein
MGVKSRPQPSPLWVKLGPQATPELSPLYPQQQASLDHPGLSGITLKRALLAFISRFGSEHIKLRRQAIKASCNVAHNEGAVLRDTGPSREVFVLFCEGSALCGAQH